MLKFFRNMWDTNQKELNRIAPLVTRINELEAEFMRLSDQELKNKTAEFKARLQKGETLNDLLPEAFATVREAAKRTLGQRHYDVQLIGGVVLHEGKIAEMKTGEGKTLAATLPAYLNALTGRGVHVVTVNDYLAKRDSEWMGKIYRFLGLSVGVIIHGLNPEERRAAYNADITYGTNNEFGFDYLRDNMAISQKELVQRELHYAIVDEVDSILIDEARTPLIISGQAEESTRHYSDFARIANQLKRDVDYTVDEKARSVAVTEEGVAKVEKRLGIDNLYAPERTTLVHHLIQALKAKELMKRDRDYVVKDGQVIIVDEFTGRLMFGRRYSEGLHQAIEAKENVKIERESQTLATITFQNYFRMYEKLAGMTGTAETEELEFRKIYGLDVVVIPTNLPMIRIDYPDVVYKTSEAKFRAVLEEIETVHKTGRPVLVGTISIEKSEALSKALTRKGIKHQVLNAKYHEQEAEIIAQAGRLGMVTIATNMAGRGTDIILGGNAEALAREILKKKGNPEEATPEEVAAALQEAKAITEREHEQVVSLGGLHIIGTERHESRRIDNQLRGRAGRQGDPGSSRFFVAMDDDLMRLFGGETIVQWMERLGWEDDMPIEHPRIAKAIENAQRRVEMRNFEIRRQVLEYDDVLNKQRETIYSLRRKLLLGEDLKDQVLEALRDVIAQLVLAHTDARLPEEWEFDNILQAAEQIFLPVKTYTAEELATAAQGQAERLKEFLYDAAVRFYADKEERIGAANMRAIERYIMLRTIDNLWIDHLQNMDDLREGVGLRAYAQEDPLVVYKIESYQMFQELLYAIKEDVVRYVFKMEFTQEAPRPERRITNIVTNRGEDGAPVVQQRKTGKKVGRNDPCPCGSGKKYKKCCGA
ncbi:MAG TPA: preprotein translocase subunit SecA [Firmicutes bacterium]|uniref:Protein translocase subunit SecA n=1 Tax=Capillibacterium thermochitinicola TaxID=2699427 RepID=A0A8J6I0G1_9FIRM|nr:preprotein translocase subunit SecA [Capillibacterium thermochitinicola]MBA2133350.1 preprotein translocase subunit SecA [Capillibacterium thermochitinicola]HHW11809.1 preprotein translocase subunit SecA [Bacillota bacterium]